MRLLLGSRLKNRKNKAQNGASDDEADWKSGDGEARSIFALFCFLSNAEK